VLRSHPLTLQVETGELTLLSSDVDAVVNAARQWAHDVGERAERQAHERPGDVELAAEVESGVERLTETLLTTPSGLRDPALVLSDDEVRTLRKVLGEMQGYQRVALTPSLQRLVDDL
jgi:hypothetical protein